ncbi:MAG: hypothetical protein LUE26_09015 [Alistipes sp.]|nr:hypothetical protein [Alistipes sp.]
MREKRLPVLWPPCHTVAVVPPSNMKIGAFPVDRKAVVTRPALPLIVLGQKTLYRSLTDRRVHHAVPHSGAFGSPAA